LHGEESDNVDEKGYTDFSEFVGKQLSVWRHSMKALSKNEAITSSSPLPFALITAHDEQGRPNVIGLSWVTITSWDP
jgi:flavin reductase (DIM6/NTAB) family NADH-FMN oxidoreductase RutF